MAIIDLRVPRGRRRRFAEIETLRDNPPANAGKRAHYIGGIGLLHGVRDITVYVKIRLGNSGSKEIKLGLLSSFSFQKLDDMRRDLQGRADRGEPLEDISPLTFRQHAADWLERKKPVVKGFGTLKGHVDGHLNPMFGHLLLTAIKVGDVDRWAAKQCQKGLKPATVNRQLSTLKAILNDAEKGGLLKQNPATRADRIKGATPRLTFLSAEQLEVVLATAKTIEDADNANAAVMPF
jgi:hypothetical protein